jgi:tRNA(His) 5'-end guanylyltransferase
LIATSKNKTMGKNTSFGDRMKEYESCYNFKIPNRSYVIIRLDGKGFSKYTTMFDKPFDDILSNVMDAATIELCKYLNPLFAYTQSDEISLVFSTIENIDADLPFDGKVQKLCSISASKVTAAFNKTMLRMLAAFKPEEFNLMEKIISGEFPELDAVFDSRVFVIPDFREVSNYFIWRQQDCTRNSISMAAHALLGHSATMNKSSDEKQEMLFKEKGVNWSDYKVKYKRGVVVKKQTIWVDGQNGEPIQRSKWLPDYDIPIFTQEREYLYNLIPVIKITEDNVV